MLLLHKGGAFYAESDFEEKATVKNAGFWWHPKGCAGEREWRGKKYPCKACEAGVPGGHWWTPDTAKAARLSEYADDGARAALGEHTAAVEASRATDATDLDIPAPEGYDYLPYQRAGIAYAMGRRATLIGDEMGLGKTIQALGILNADPDARTALIVVPASLRINWVREAGRWLTDDHWAPYVVEETAPVPAAATLVIVNYERLLKSEVFDSLMAREWDLLVMDEAHYCKNPEAKRTVACFGRTAKPRKKIAAKDGLVHRAGRVVLLTGTPMLNRPKEMFPLINALDPDTWRNFFTFAKRYCNAQQTRWGWDMDGASNLPELQEKLRATVMVRRLKADVLTELPPKRRQVIELPPNGSSGLVEQEQRAWAAHEDKLDAIRDDLELAAAAGNEDAYQAAVARLKDGMQLAFTEISQARHKLALAKVEAATGHIDDALEATEDKLIVFAHHHDVIDALMEHFGAQAVKLDGRMGMDARQVSIDRFQNDPDVRVFVGQIKAAGVGITLTAASTVLFVELAWTPGDMSQAEDRAHRIGQENAVLVQHLVFDGSLDSKMAKALVQKQAWADKALDNDTAAPLITEPVSPSGRKRPQRPRQYPKASEAQRQAAGEAVMTLAGRCDGAQTEDGAGFNKIDTRIGHELASVAAAGKLTDGQVWLCTRLARTYRRQLGPHIWEALSLDPKEKTA